MVILPGLLVGLSAARSCQFAHQHLGMIKSLRQFIILLYLRRDDIEDNLFLGLTVGVKKDVFLGVEDELRLIIEIHLNYFVIESECDSLVGFGPSSDINKG